MMKGPRSLKEKSMYATSSSLKEGWDKMALIIKSGINAPPMVTALWHLLVAFPILSEAER